MNDHDSLVDNQKATRKMLQGLKNCFSCIDCLLPRALKKRSSCPKMTEGLTITLSGNSERKAASPSARDCESFEAAFMDERAVET